MGDAKRKRDRGAQKPITRQQRLELHRRIVPPRTLKFTVGVDEREVPLVFEIHGDGKVYQKRRGMLRRVRDPKAVAFILEKLEEAEAARIAREQEDEQARDGMASRLIQLSQSGPLPIGLL